MAFNTFGGKRKETGVRVQLWAEVDGVKHGGGTIDLSGEEVGFTILAGTPVAIDKSGGELLAYNGDDVGMDALKAHGAVGLLWHDIRKEEGDILGTGAVVDKGRILEDRMPYQLSAEEKAELPSIKFEKGI